MSASSASVEDLFGTPGYEIPSNFRGIPLLIQYDESTALEEIAEGDVVTIGVGFLTSDGAMFDQSPFPEWFTAILEAAANELSLNIETDLAESCIGFEVSDFDVTDEALEGDPSDEDTEIVGEILGNFARLVRAKYSATVA